MNIDSFTTFLKTQPSTISYHSNQEYRQWIRTLFRFASNIYSNYADIKIDITTTNTTTTTNTATAIEMDDETRDELEFDTEKMKEIMEILFLATKEHPFFQELYLHAAGRMFSTDPSIGQAVVCSYDTFSWYYTCARHFLINKGIDIDSENYQKLEDLTEYRKLQEWFSFS